MLVLKATDHLATRLEAIIAEILAPHLGGLEWTAILVEMDRLKGKRLTTISPNDLQSQLRVLTERLGELGYPFDDESRTVSTVASDLRTVRRNLAHTNPFTELEAWRAADHCVRLLEALGDQGGLVAATEVRHQAFLAYAERSGLGPAPAQAEGEVDAVAGDSRKRSGAKTPASAEGKRSVQEIVHGERGDVYYEPWPGHQAGDVSVLDTIARKESKGQVQSLAEEIVDFEWPIALERLAREVARGFGLRRVTKDRTRKIIRQIHNSGLYVDEYDFVWPTKLDRDEWSGYRTAEGVETRPIEEISPNEIANALLVVRRDALGSSDEEQELLVMERFGRSKKTQGVVRQLNLAWELL